MNQLETLKKASKTIWDSRTEKEREFISTNRDLFKMPFLLDILYQRIRFDVQEQGGRLHLVLHLPEDVGAADFRDAIKPAIKWRKRLELFQSIEPARPRQNPKAKRKQVKTLFSADPTPLQREEFILWLKERRQSESLTAIAKSLSHEIEEALREDRGMFPEYILACLGCRDEKIVELIATAEEEFANGSKVDILTKHDISDALKPRRSYKRKR